MIIFRQLYDPETSTYTYLLGDGEAREAVLIDSVRERFDRDATITRELDLRVVIALETHVHADHVTASGRWRDSSGARVAIAASAGVRNADLALKDGDLITFGAHHLEARSTPGHTGGCMTFVCHALGCAFTGDALLIRGCGRTDFQEGDASVLYRSVHERVLSLPGDTRLYPGHDYAGRTMSTVAEEKKFNARLGSGKSQSDFVAIMEGLNLAYPKRIDEAVPANLESGMLAEPTESAGAVAGVMDSLGRQDAAELFQGSGI